MKDKINELQAGSENKNIRDLYVGVNELKVYHLLTNLEKMKMVI
jgi:hypothetical protein